METKTIELLEKLEETSEEFWNVSHQTGCFINMLIKLMKAQNVLELGTSNGYSGLWIADALKETGGHLTTIEFWEKRQCIARKNFDMCGFSDIVSFKTGQAYDIIKDELTEMFDLVFIDANKQEYLHFFEAVNPLVKNGGVILADNVLSHAKKVQPFVEAITSHRSYQVQTLDLPDGLLMAYKLREQS
ncbi:MAG: O-methyltransferase [Candidatus Gastranaerophilales bacterium]|nr:O-methyltransferase [Candidatus Gastranaerophilales bacterium]